MRDYELDVALAVLRQRADELHWGWQSTKARPSERVMCATERDVLRRVVAALDASRSALVIRSDDV